MFKKCNIFGWNLKFHESYNCLKMITLLYCYNLFLKNEEDNDVQENVDNDEQNDSYQVINESG